MAAKIQAGKQGMPSESRARSDLQTLSRSLAVVVVTHNDGAGLSTTVERLLQALIVTVEDFEIIIFDDASSDETGSIANELAQRHGSVRVRRFDQRMGMGACFLAGCGEASASFVVYVPGNCTSPHRSFVELFGNIGKADVVTSYSNNFMADLPWFRRQVSRAYTALLGILFRRRLHYYNGLTIYPTAYLRKAKIRARGFGFQAETLLKALGGGCSFIEIPLPTNATGQPSANALTGDNVGDAVLTIARLAWDLWFARTRHDDLAVAPLVQKTQGLDELGLRSGKLQVDGPHEPSPVTKLRIVVVGASSGIGAAVARALARDGHRLVLAARRKDRLEALAAELPGSRAMVCDVTDAGQVARLGAEVAGLYGGCVDVLINCAGGFGEIGPVEHVSSEGWWQTLRTNLFGPYQVIHQMIPLLRQGHSPRIINMAGGGAFSAFPNYSAYACAKAALVRLTECLAVELQPAGIRVNAVSPGFIATDFHKATLDAGEEKAGKLQYRRTLSIFSDGGPSMENVVECMRALISPAFDGLTGKTISCNFDPWQTEAFQVHIADITRSDLYSLRRVNLANLGEGYLHSALTNAWADFGNSP